MTPAQSWMFLGLLFGLMTFLFFGDRWASRIVEFILDSLAYGGKKSW